MQPDDPIFQKIEARLKADRRRDRVVFWYLGLPVLIAGLWAILFNLIHVRHPNAGSYFGAFLVGLIPAILLGPRCMALRRRRPGDDGPQGPST